MNKKMCLAAAIQKYKVAIDIKRLRCHDGLRLYVCEMRGDRIIAQHESGASWDALFGAITGLGKFKEPEKEDPKRGSKRKQKGRPVAV